MIDEIVEKPTYQDWMRSLKAKAIEAQKRYARAYES